MTVRPQYSAVIKATTETEARAYAEVHSLKVISLHAIIPDAREVVLVVEGDVADLAIWLSEPGHSEPGYGFPLGTLLIYSEIENIPILRKAPPRLSFEDGMGGRY